MEVLHKTVNPHFKSDTNQSDSKMQKKITQKKIDDFIGRIDWKMQYDDKNYISKEFAYHCREVIVLFH